jgi:hypothetical protein
VPAWIKLPIVFKTVSKGPAAPADSNRRGAARNGGLKAFPAAYLQAVLRPR